MTLRTLKTLWLACTAALLAACSNVGDGRLPTHDDWVDIITRAETTQWVTPRSIEISGLSCRAMEREGVEHARSVAIAWGKDPDQIKSFTRCTLSYTVVRFNSFVRSERTVTIQINDRPTLYIVEGGKGRWIF